MGFENFRTDDSSDNSSGGSRKYVRPDRREFEEFLSENDYNWSMITNVSESASDMRKFSYEYIYEIPLETKYQNLVIRIFSTIDSRTDTARDKGKDAIRCVIWDKNIRRPIGGREKTLRIETWKKNLKKKIEFLKDNWNEQVEECSSCDRGWMVEREGKYGKFLGCTNYPNCKVTKEIDE